MPTLPGRASLSPRSALPRLLFLAASLAVVVRVPAPTTRGAEPPLRLVPTIGGSPHVLLDGQATEIELAGAKLQAKVEVRPVRRFEGTGVAFDFPRDMACSRDHGPGYTAASLDMRNRDSRA